MSVKIRRAMRLGAVFVVGAFTLAGEVVRLPAKMLVGCSFPWLGTAETGVVTEVKVMSLSCRMCLDEVTDIFNGVEPGPRHLILNTTDPTDQSIAWNWLVASLAQPEATDQRAVARELLAIYVDSPEVYLADPELWRRLCRERWADNSTLLADGGIWARCLNTLQQQNRWLALLERHTTPDVIKIEDGGIELPAETPFDGEARRMQIWEASEPALRPNWDTVASDTGDARPVLHRVSLDPSLPLSADSWWKLREQLAGGGLFEWESGAAMRDPVFRRWLGEFFSRPTLALRRAWFDRAVLAAEDLARKTRKRVSLTRAIEQTFAAQLELPLPETFGQAADFEIWATGLQNR